MLGRIVRRGAWVLLDVNSSCAREKVSPLTIAGTGISIHSFRGLSWFALLRSATPPRMQSGRVTRCRGRITVLPKQAVPLYAGLRRMAHTIERHHLDTRLRVGTPCSLSNR